MKEQRFIDDLIKKNPDIRTVLAIAEHARISENLKSPVQIVYPTDVIANPSPEHQGSLVIPAATQKA